MNGVTDDNNVIATKLCVCYGTDEQECPVFLKNGSRCINSKFVTDTLCSACNTRYNRFFAANKQKSATKGHSISDFLINNPLRTESTSLPESFPKKPKGYNKEANRPVARLITLVTPLVTACRNDLLEMNIGFCFSCDDINKENYINVRFPLDTLIICLEICAQCYSKIISGKLLVENIELLRDASSNRSILRDCDDHTASFNCLATGSCSVYCVSRSSSVSAKVAALKSFGQQIAFVCDFHHHDTPVLGKGISLFPRSSESADVCIIPVAVFKRGKANTTLTNAKSNDSGDLTFLQSIFHCNRTLKADITATAVLLCHRGDTLATRSPLHLINLLKQVEFKDRTYITLMSANDNIASGTTCSVLELLGEILLQPPSIADWSSLNAAGRYLSSMLQQTNRGKRGSGAQRTSVLLPTDVQLGSGSGNLYLLSQDNLPIKALVDNKGTHYFNEWPKPEIPDRNRKYCVNINTTSNPIIGRVPK